MNNNKKKVKEKSGNEARVPQNLLLECNPAPDDRTCYTTIKRLKCIWVNSTTNSELSV